MSLEHGIRKYKSFVFALPQHLKLRYNGLKVSNTELQNIHLDTS